MTQGSGQVGRVGGVVITGVGVVVVVVGMMVVFGVLVRRVGLVRREVVEVVVGVVRLIFVSPLVEEGRL